MVYAGITQRVYYCEKLYKVKFYSTGMYYNLGSVYWDLSFLVFDFLSSFFYGFFNGIYFSLGVNKVNYFIILV